MKNIDRVEVLSNEYVEVNNIIALAKADEEVRQILIDEIITQGLINEEEIRHETEILLFEEKTHEIINLAKATPQRLCYFLCEIVKDDKTSKWLQQYFYDYFGSQGLMRDKI